MYEIKVTLVAEKYPPVGAKASPGPIGTLEFVEAADLLTLTETTSNAGCGVDCAVSVASKHIPSATRAAMLRIVQVSLM
jgi:hypothetical protein